MSRLSVLSLVCLTAFIASSAGAQIIYEPVRYQYGQGRTWYYGGSDPRMFRVAEGPASGAGRWGRVQGWAFVSGNVHTHREVATEMPRVFSDAIGYRNAYPYGYTATDARNEAYARVPRYFRKADLLETAEQQTDGSLLVPSQPRPGGPRIYQSIPPAAPLPVRKPLVDPRAVVRAAPMGSNQG